MESIEKFELPDCPYCGSKLWHAEAFLAKNHQFYKCKYCKNESEVCVRAGAFKLLGICETAALAIFAAAVFAGGSYCLLGIALIAVLFSGFYAFSPFTVRLGKVKRKRREQFKEKSDEFESMKKKSGEDTETEIYSN